MSNFVVSIIGGASLGGVYALISLGLVLGYRATGTFNFAHGQFMYLPAIMVATWQAQESSLPFWVALPIALATVAVVGILFYLLVLRRMVGMPHFMGVIATLALAAIIDGVLSIKFGTGDARIEVPGLPTGSVEVLGSRFSAASLVLTAFTLVLAATVAAVLRFSRLGTRVRAAGQDPVLASQGGINVRSIYMGSWAVSAALAGVAGVALGATTLVSPSMTAIALAAFPAILLGGLDSIEGALVGGILIGIFQGFVATYWGGAVIDAASYTVLLLVLLVRPQGLFGTVRVERV
jgi:branched-chain amino acid transport system permease protein